MSLGELRDTRAIEALIAALKDEKGLVRSSATEALGEIKDPRAIEPLIAALRDEGWLVRQSATKALAKITGQDFGQDVIKWQEWWEKNKAKKE